jgi:hypothetical protein
MPGYTVVTEALGQESGKWINLADSMGVVRAATERMTLEATAFFIGDANTVPHYMAYQQFQTTMTSLLSEGETAFLGVSQVLREIQNRYDNAEDVIELDLNEVFSAQGE